MKDLTADELRDAISYSPVTGEFRWRPVSVRDGIGRLAGGMNKEGYMTVSVRGKLYRAHRLAWLYHYGKWPDGVIDHINGDQADNRICNLRDVSRSVNGQNRKRANRNNKVGLLGVSIQYGRIYSIISINGKLTKLGMHETVEEAHASYLEAKRKLHEGCTI